MIFSFSPIDSPPSVVPVKICDFDLASGLKEVRELRNKIGSAGRSAGSSASSGFQSGGQSFDNPIGHHDFQPFNFDVGGESNLEQVRS